ncbi:cation transporter dimerization domain-containing protein [Cetobacterium sp.]|uniref:cation transporter dimerization domain-containing protein n=1 Tax=Cetobacterium sp. TaxID=2071632 RepID=UPI003F3CDB7A
MVDVSCDEKIVEEIKRLILEEVGVKGIDFLKTRIFGAKFYIDLEIAVDEDISHIYEINFQSCFEKIKNKL